MNPASVRIMALSAMLGVGMAAEARGDAPQRSEGPIHPFDPEDHDRREARYRAEAEARAELRARRQAIADANAAAPLTRQQRRALERAEAKAAQSASLAQDRRTGNRRRGGIL